MQPEDRDRLARMEVKIDMLLPYIKTTARLDKDVSFIKKSLGVVWTGVVAIAGILVSGLVTKYFK